MGIRDRRKKEYSTAVSKQNSQKEAMLKDALDQVEVELQNTDKQLLEQLQLFEQKKARDLKQSKDS